MIPEFDIASREDFRKLVGLFYGKVRKHDRLGPIFNEVILDWEEHLEKITDFWMNTVFYENDYHGNPLRKHLNLDIRFKEKIEQAHFGNWLELWFATVDEHFHGEKAHLAKERARNMAHIMYLRIYEQRQGIKGKIK